MLLLGAPGAGAGRVARALSEHVFGYHPRIVHGDVAEQLMGPPRRDDEGAGGWLYRVVANNWRRDELDPFSPDQPPPATRMRLVARAPTRRARL